MSATYLQLIQQVSNELGLASPTYVAGNTNQEVVQLASLMNAAGYELTYDYEWQALQVEHRFYTQYVDTTGATVAGSPVITNVANFLDQDGNPIDSTFMTPVGVFPQDCYVVSIDQNAGTVTMDQPASQTQSSSGQVLFCKTKYDLPPDYFTITDRTQWDKSKHWMMLGPDDAQQWQWLKSGYISTGPRIRWRILDNQFQTWPPMSTQEYLGFEYRSKGWARSPAGVIQNSFTADNDTCIYPDRIMVLATKLKFFQIKNFDTTALLQDYNRYLSIAKADDKGAGNLSFAPYPTELLIGWVNIPDSGYGT
jgi:hypothetical protein